MATAPQTAAAGTKPAVLDNKVLTAPDTGAAAASAQREKNGGTVVICSKLPHAIEIRLHKMHEDKNADGTLIAKRAIATSRKFTLLGANSSKVIGGYGVTRNIPEDFWDEWVLQAGEWAPLTNGVIFKQTSVERAVDQAREMGQHVRSGFEGLDRKKPGAKLEEVPEEEDD